MAFRRTRITESRKPLLESKSGETALKIIMRRYIHACVVKIATYFRLPEERERQYLAAKKTDNQQPLEFEAVNRLSGAGRAGPN